MPNTQLEIALLGWGSLIWDQRPEFDNQHEDWQSDGPVLPLEFSRVSQSRKRALTLVIDPNHGENCTVHFAFSKRSNPDDAFADLRRREHTAMNRIGFWFADHSRTCKPDVPPAIVTWAQSKEIDVVVWTGLPSNFKEETKEVFSIAAAIRHLQSLPPDAKAMAAEYVSRAPNLVNTPLRRALQVELWFAPIVFSN